LTVSSFIPGKLILLGEYAVLEGAPAIVSAVNKFAKIEIKESNDNHFYISAPNLNLIDIKFQKGINKSQKKQLKLFLNIFSFILKKNNSLIPCKITIDTDDFYFENSKQKIGLGSSAAMTFGLIESIYKFNKFRIADKNDLFQIALQAHFEAQGKTGSGIDIAASAFGGVGIYSKIEKNLSFKHIKLPEDLYVIPIWTGYSTSTPQFVSKTNQLKQKKLKIYTQIMQELSELSTQGCEFILNDDTLSFLNVVNEYFESLDTLGKSAEIPIISDIHKKIAGIVKICNGFYKPSGAGGSDIGIAFTNDKDVKKDIIEKINNSQFKYIKLETYIKK